MATGTNTGDIHIRVGGSTPATIIARANALNSLAMSLMTLNGALTATGAGGGIGGGLANVNNHLNQYNRGAGTARQRTDAFGTALNGGGNALDRFMTLFSRMLRIMTAYFIISRVTEAIRDLVTSLFQAPAQMELWNTQLRVLVGNATQAAEKMRLLQTVAIESPQNLKDLVSGLVTLTAFHVETSQRTLSLLTDLAAVTGQTFQHVSEVAGKVIQGSPQAITRSLPVLGIDPKEFRRVAAETGSRATALFRIIEEKFAGFASESTNTILGLVEKIRDTFFVLASEIGSGLIPIMRQALTGVFEWMNELRNSPEALERMRVKIRILGEAIVTWGQRILAVIKFLKMLYDSIGGISTIIFVLAVTNLPRLAAMLTSLTLMNPWLLGLAAAATALGAAVDFATKPMREHEKAAKEAAMAQRMFGEALVETSNKAAKDISLVNADEAEAYAKRLRSIAMGTDRQAFALGPGALIPELKNPHLMIETAQRWTHKLADSFDVIAKRARAAMGVVSTSVGEIEDDLDAHADWLKKINGWWSEASELIDASFQMQKNWLTQIDDDWKAHAQTLDTITQLQENYRDQQRQMADDRFQKPFDVLQARLASGAISKTEAVAQAKVMRDALVNEVTRLLSSGDPLDTEIAIRLQAVIENVDSFTEGLKSEVSQALETSLRDIVKDGATAISTALADMVVSVDGKGFGAAMMGLVAAFMNTLGDALIQLGIAKLAFDAVISGILNMVPGGGLAAIAAGIALKTFAGIITNSIAKSANGANAGGGGGGSPSGGGMTTFQPARYQSASVNEYNIYAFDAQSAEEYVTKHPHAFAASVQHVKNRDKQTAGSAYGVFGG